MTNYNWPLEVLASIRDQPQGPRDASEINDRMASDGLDESLIEFLAPLYSDVDGSTLFNKLMRIHPPSDLPRGHLGGLAEWNRPDGRKQYEPQKINGTFYFCSNCFGDQFGIPIDTNGKILADRIGILWVERAEYQEAKLDWRNFFLRLASEEPMRSSFLRKNEFDWAAPVLGFPEPWQCFS